MVEWDADGIYRDAYGHTYFKRYARWYEDGKRCVGGIFLTKSDDQTLYVQLFEEVSTSVDQEEATVIQSANYAPTDRFGRIALTERVRVFERGLPVGAVEQG